MVVDQFFGEAPRMMVYLFGFTTAMALKRAVTDEIMNQILYKLGLKTPNRPELTEKSDK